MKQVNLKIKIPNWLYDTAVFAVLLYRRLRYGYPYRRIPLTRGKFAIVDPEDFDRLNCYRWYASRDNHTCYAKRYVSKAQRQKNNASAFMHREVMKYKLSAARSTLSANLLVDHINHNGLDNRKANLRVVTPAENSRNKRLFAKPSASGYRGVWYNPNKKRFRASITFNYKKIHIGSFKNPKAAAKAYDTAAKKYHGQFAVLNFK